MVVQSLSWRISILVYKTAKLTLSELLPVANTHTQQSASSESSKLNLARDTASRALGASRMYIYSLFHWFEDLLPLKCFSLKYLA